MDTHAHLDMPHFDADREEVITRARDAGVVLINTIGIDVDSSRQAIALAENHPGILASVGIHPGEAAKARREEMDKLKLLARHPKVIAVGELGLDFYHKEPPEENQLQLLRWELELAKEVQLPIIIHCRQAQDKMLPIMDDWVSSYKPPEGRARGVVHCFSGDIETAQWYLERGFYISIGAYIGYPSSAQLRATLASIPLERLVIETDCPFLPPQKYRGKRNEPAYTVMTLNVLSEIKGQKPSETAVQTTRNAVRLFNLTGRGIQLNGLDLV